MIDYSLLSRSISYYEKWGFKRIESPWTVTSQVGDITKPDNAKNFKLAERDKVLVASAEQSFLYLFLKGFLPAGQYQSVTPCFRDEPFDKWHTKYFIKNELIKTDCTSKKDLSSVIEVARLFFDGLGFRTKVVSNHDPKFNSEVFDICTIIDNQEIELGSYGIRKCSFLTWIFGTGLAEPRTSTIWTHGLKYGLSSK